MSVILNMYIYTPIKRTFYKQQCNTSTIRIKVLYYKTFMVNLKSKSPIKSHLGRG